MKSFCRDKGVESESELIRQAISKYIYYDYTDETLKIQVLKKKMLKIDELKDMVNILFSYLIFMHKNLLAYHAEIDSEYVESAFISSSNRHDKFFNAFQNSLKNEPAFFEKLLHKFYTEDSSGQV
jgi:hypothetical protein